MATVFRFTFIFLLIFKVCLSQTFNYSIITPKILHEGREEIISVHVSFTPVLLTIKANSTTLNNQTTISNQFKRVVLKFDPSFGGDVELRFILQESCSQKPCSLLAEEVVVLPIISNEPIMLTEISKPVYKPEDTVKFRCIIVNAIDLAPKDDLRFDLIYIEDAKKRRLKQWTSVNWNEAFEGFSFYLSKDPSLGEWNIFSQSGKNQTISTFIVKKYTLPKFSVVIEPPKSLIATDTHINFKVCAEYSTGRPIKSTVKATVCISNMPCWKKNVLLDGRNKCVPISVTMSTVFKQNLFKSYYVYTCKINATVIEEGTGESVEDFVNLGRIENTPMKITINGSPVFRPGLPYYATVVVKYHDGSAYSKATVSCRSSISNWLKNGESQVTDDAGLLRLQVPTYKKTSRFSISCSSSTNIKSQLSRISNSFTNWFVEGSSDLFSQPLTPRMDDYLQIVPFDRQQDNEKSELCSGNLKVKLQATSDLGNASIIAYILSRGISKPLEVTKQGMWSRDANTNKIYTINVNASLQSSGFVDGHLGIFVPWENSVILADWVELSLFNQCFLQLNTTFFRFSESESKPGSHVNANLGFSGQNPKCALRISDINLNHFGQAGNVNSAQLLRSLTNVNHLQKEGNPNKKISKRLCKTSRDVDVSSQVIGLFDSVGLVVLTNLNIVDVDHCISEILRKDNVVMFDEGGPIPENGQNSPGSVNKNEEGNNQQKEKIRDFFPETWKFEVLKNPSNAINLTVPDTLTTWESSFYCLTSNGLGIASSDQITAFSSFYIQATLPYSIFRGEIAVLPVKIFNYLPNCIQIHVTISESDSFIIESAKSTKLCSCNFDLKTVTFKIRAKALGRKDIFISAQTSSSNDCESNNGRYSGKHFSDTVRRSILVEAEGIPEISTVGDLVCVDNEKKILNLAARLPEDVVSDSARGYIVWSADILGPSLSNLDKLVRQPFGCGEQNMITLVPSIYILNYFAAMNIVKPDIIEKAMLYVKSGYERELQYRHKDGSFSAFGASDKFGSSWLTAFVLKSFIEARKYTEVDKDVLSKAVSFLVKQQDSTGCFKEPGRVIHNEMKGSSASDKATLTAYILSAIADTDERILPTRTSIINSAIYCIRSHTPQNIKDLKLSSLALRTFALGKVNKTDSLFIRYRTALKEAATVSNGLIYWMPILKKSVEPKRWWDHTSSAEIETTGYALLSLINNQTKLVSLQTVRWLTQMQNAEGGWISTQDTIIGLHSLSKFANSLSFSDGSAITITANSSEMRKTEVIDETKRLLTWKIPINVPNSVEVTVEGKGCAVVKVNTHFNLNDSVRLKPAFKVNINSSKTSPTTVRLYGCTEYLSNSSNMVVMEIQMQSGWIPVKSSLENIRQNQMTDGGLRRIDEKEGKLEIYFDAFTRFQRKCVDIELTQKVVIDKGKPATAIVYDYYNPKEASESLYSLDLSKSFPIPTQRGISTAPRDSPNLCLSIILFMIIVYTIN